MRLVHLTWNDQFKVSKIFNAVGNVKLLVLTLEAPDKLREDYVCKAVECWDTNFSMDIESTCDHADASFVAAQGTQLVAINTCEQIFSFSTHPRDVRLGTGGCETPPLLQKIN